MKLGEFEVEEISSISIEKVLEELLLTISVSSKELVLMPTWLTGVNQLECIFIISSGIPIDSLPLGEWEDKIFEISEEIRRDEFIEFYYDKSGIPSSVWGWLANESCCLLSNGKMYKILNSEELVNKYYKGEV